MASNERRRTAAELRIEGEALSHAKRVGDIQLTGQAPNAIHSVYMGTYALLDRTDSGTTGVPSMNGRPIYSALSSGGSAPRMGRVASAVATGLRLARRLSMSMGLSATASPSHTATVQPAANANTNTNINTATAATATAPAARARRNSTRMDRYMYHGRDGHWYVGSAEHLAHGARGWWRVRSTALTADQIEAGAVWHASDGGVDAWSRKGAAAPIPFPAVCVILASQAQAQTRALAQAQASAAAAPAAAAAAADVAHSSADLTAPDGAAAGTNQGGPKSKPGKQKARAVGADAAKSAWVPPPRPEELPQQGARRDHHCCRRARGAEYKIFNWSTLGIEVRREGEPWTLPPSDLQLHARPGGVDGSAAGATGTGASSIGGSSGIVSLRPALIGAAIGGSYHALRVELAEYDDRLNWVFEVERRHLRALRSEWRGTLGFEAYFVDRRNERDDSPARWQVCGDVCRGQYRARVPGTLFLCWDNSVRRFGSTRFAYSLELRHGLGRKAPKERLLHLAWKYQTFDVGTLQQEVVKRLGPADRSRLAKGYPTPGDQRNHAMADLYADALELHKLFVKNEQLVRSQQMDRALHVQKELAYALKKRDRARLGVGLKSYKTMGLEHRPEFEAAESMVPELELEQQLGRLEPLMNVCREARSMDWAKHLFNLDNALRALHRHLERKREESQDQGTGSPKTNEATGGATPASVVPAPTKRRASVVEMRRSSLPAAAGERVAIASLADAIQKAEDFRRWMDERIAALEHNKKQQLAEQQKLWLARTEVAIANVTALAKHLRLAYASGKRTQAVPQPEDLLPMRKCLNKLVDLGLTSHALYRRGEKLKERFLSFAATEAYRDNLRNADGALLPESSFFLRWWDWIVVFCIAFVVVVAPYAATAPQQTPNGDVPPVRIVDCFDWVVDVLLLCDVAITFKVAFFDSEQTQMWVKNTRRIAQRYLRGVFCVDIVGVVPLPAIARAITSPQPLTPRFALALHCIKLLRVARCPRIFGRIRQRCGSIVANSTWALGGAMAFVMIFLHWSACLWAMLPELEGDAADTERQQGTRVQYVHCLMHALHATVSSSAMFDSHVKPATHAERCVATALMVLGGTVFALVVGTVSSILINRDPGSVQYQRALDMLARWTTEDSMAGGVGSGAPLPLKRRMRKHFTSCCGIFRQRFYLQHLMHTLSPQLQKQIALTLHSQWIDANRVPFFSAQSNAEREIFLLEMALRLETVAFAAQECIYSRGESASNICILMSGLASRNGSPLLCGDVFGEDMLAGVLANRVAEEADAGAGPQRTTIDVVRHDSVSALTFCMCSALSLDGLLSILRGRQAVRLRDTARTIRRAAIRVVLRAAVRSIGRSMRVIRQARGSGPWLKSERAAYRRRILDMGRRKSVIAFDNAPVSEDAGAGSEKPPLPGSKVAADELYNPKADREIVQAQAVVAQWAARQWNFKRNKFDSSAVIAHAALEEAKKLTGKDKKGFAQVKSRLRDQLKLLEGSVQGGAGRGAAQLNATVGDIAPAFAAQMRTLRACATAAARVRDASAIDALERQGERKLQRARKQEARARERPAPPPATIKLRPDRRQRVNAACNGLFFSVCNVSHQQPLRVVAVWPQSESHQQVDLSVYACAGPWQSAVHSTPLWRRIGRRIVQKPSQPIRIALNPPPLLMPGQVQGILLHSPTSCSAIGVHEYRGNVEGDDDEADAPRQRKRGSKQRERRRQQQQAHAADAAPRNETRVVAGDQSVNIRVGQTCFMHTMPAALAEVAGAEGAQSGTANAANADAQGDGLSQAAFCGVLEYAKVDVGKAAEENESAQASDDMTEI